MNDSFSGELRRLVGSLLALTERLPDQHDQTLFFQAPANIRQTDAELAAFARRTVECRMVRKQHLPEDMFAEGGWNIMLDAFICEHRGDNVAVTDACLASDVPSTTALRHLSLLIERGLIQKAPDPKDSRRAFVMLTPAGRNAIRAVLSAMFEIDERHRAEWAG